MNSFPEQVKTIATVDYAASNNKSHGGCLLNCAVIIHHALELISGSVKGGEMCMVPHQEISLTF